jgi:prevent-host-death family protein
MYIPVSEAKARLTDLVRRAEEGDEVVLTRHGQPAVRLVPVTRPPSRDRRLALFAELQKSAAAKLLPGPDAARGHDFLYDEDGLPR